MKQIIIVFFAFIYSITSYCQVSNLEDGNQCFNNGDYTCAEAKYKEVFKTSAGKEKKIAEIKIQRAKRCIENLKNASLEFNNGNYTKAKEFYLAVLDSNPNDELAKKQLDLINNTFLKSPQISLDVSKKEISYRSSGGNEYVNLTTNSKTYTIELLPSWCTVQKYDAYFVINCTNNYQGTARSDYFNVKAGDKTIRVNISQEGVANKIETSLSLSKSNLFFSQNGGDENIIVTTNDNNFSVTLVPSWCTIQKFSTSIVIKCSYNNSNQSRSDWFKIIAGNKEVRVYVDQSGGNNNEITSIEKKLHSFSSIGFQSGEIAKYGFIYERGGRKTVGFRFSARTSLTPEEDILNGKVLENKTELELGPNFRLLNRLYLNIGVGYGFYDRIMNNDYSGKLYLEKTGYTVATTGLMYRVSRTININGGASFMDIEKDFYKPEITFGVTYNLKKNNISQINASSIGKKYKPSRQYKPKLSSFSSLGFQSGEIAKYGLLYETGGRSSVGFRISARTTLKPEQIISGEDIENKKEIELGPNFRMSNRIYLNLGIGYGSYDYVIQDYEQGTIRYYTATTGIMFRISRIININGGLSFMDIDKEIYKPEITFGISFNLRGKYRY